MKMIVTWLLGVPVAVTFFFAAFAVDVDKISPRVEPAETSHAIAIAPTATKTNSGKWQSEARLN